MSKHTQTDHEFAKTVRDLTDTDDNDAALVIVSEALKKPKEADTQGYTGDEGGEDGQEHVERGES